MLGRPSLDPMEFVKAMLAGFFRKCVTDSRLAFHLADSLTVRRFLGHGLEEEMPDRSTLVKTRPGANGPLSPVHKRGSLIPSHVQ